MTTDWLTFQSFQRSQEILRAINTLSTHLKLTLNGTPDTEHLQAADRSAETLQSFLNQLETATHQIEEGESMPILGIDPRLQELAEEMLTARRQRRFGRHGVSGRRGEIKRICTSNDRDDQEALIQYLAELRVLVEEHMCNDTSQILGAI